MRQALTSIEFMAQEKRTYGINPSRFMLWLFIVTIVMLFAGLTSAYIVKQSDGNWFYFELPSILYGTSTIIFLSSVSMQLAFFAAKKNNLKQIKIFLGTTLFLAIMFLIGQFQSWKDLVAQDVFFVGNPAGSFLYVLTGLHGLHLVSGIIFILIVLYSSIKLKVHSKNLTRIQLCTTYWHFLGALWIYLFLFLKLNN